MRTIQLSLCHKKKNAIIRQDGMALKVLLIAVLVSFPSLLYSQFKVPNSEISGQEGSQLAVDAPHWGNGINCQSCHVVHNSPAVQLTMVEGNANLCMSCHNPTGLAKDKPFSEADKAVPNVSGTSHAWGVPAINVTYGAELPTNPEMTARIYDGKIVCSTCHNQHKQTCPPFLRDSNNDDALCIDCHSVRNVGSYRDSPLNKGSHPVEPASGTICTTCHSIHYAYAGGDYPEGDGYLLRVPNNDDLCMSCHSTLPEHMGMGCRMCHQPHDPNRTNILLVKNSLNPPTGNERTVVFTSETGANSFADGDAVYDGICEVCHTQTDHFRNDGTAPDQNHGNLGGKAGSNCIPCHPHEDGFLHGGSGSGCEACHGHDPGYEYEPGLFSMGVGTTKSHSTHTENDSDDLKGPHVPCDECHDTNNFPYFKSGTDGNGDSKYVLSETDVCNNCHSSGGSYNGIDNPAMGAKNNWDDGVYDGYDLTPGKEKWCASCHDETPAIAKGVSAPKVIGNENASTPYGTGYGFYKTGHGLSSSKTYPATGATGAGIECLDCHNAKIKHIDGTARTYVPDSGYTDEHPESDNYQTGFRLKDVASGYAGKYPMHIPRTGHVFPPGFRAEWEFALCFSCHSGSALFNGGDSVTGENAGTYFRGLSDGGGGGNPAPTPGFWYSMHDVHLWGLNGPWGPTTPQYDSDFDGSADSRMSCPACHNVHGSPSPAMVRHGELIGKVPCVDFKYTPDGTFPYRYNSTGGKIRFIGPGPGTVAKNGICNMCHNDGMSYTRDAGTGGDFTRPEITNVTGQIGSNILTVIFSEEVYSDLGTAGDLIPDDFTLTDTDNGRTITGVMHAAGDIEATLTMSSALDDIDDIGIDALSAATATSIYDASDNPMEVVPVPISAGGAAPVIIHPSDIASNPGGFTTLGNWQTAMDSDDGDGSFARRCCGPPSFYFYVDMDDPPGLAGATIESIKFYVRARYIDGPWPGAGPTSGSIRIGYKTGANTLWESPVSVAPPSPGSNEYALITSAMYTTNTDGASLQLSDINNLQIAVWRYLGGSLELRITEIYVEIAYTP